MGTKNSRAFTLVELIIVITIIGALALIGILFFRGQIGKGTDARRKADINRIKVAVEEYEKDHSCYPSPDLMVCDPGTGLQPYLDKIPCDPATNASYYYEYQDAVCPSWYRIYTNLSNLNDPLVDTGIGPNSAFNYVSTSTNAPPYSAGQTGGTGGGSPSGFYGCVNGACIPINWDSSRPGPECDPNYQNPTCYGQCGPQSHECILWH
jgi:general secretion pathway protein G